MDEQNKEQRERWRDQALTEILHILQEEAPQAEVREGVVYFLWDHISQQEDWRAVGEIQFLPYIAAYEDESILQIHLTVAQNVKKELLPELAPRLMELTDAALLGRLGLDQEGHVYYTARIPLVTTQPAEIAHCAALTLYEMVDFLDNFYAYLLVLVTEPQKLTLAQYLDLLSQPPEDKTGEEHS